MKVRNGFILIELMIAVAVIALLVLIGIPSYQDYNRRAQRAEAQSFLLEVAARQQRRLLEQGAYATKAELALGDSSYYDYDIPLPTLDNTASPPAFRATATPKGSQAKDKCGVLAVDHAGVQSATGVGRCW